MGLRVNVAWGHHVPAKLPELWLGFEGSTLYLVVASKAKIPEPFPHGAQENILRQKTGPKSIWS